MEDYSDDSTMSRGQKRPSCALIRPGLRRGRFHGYPSMGHASQLESRFISYAKVRPVAGPRAGIGFVPPKKHLLAAPCPEPPSEPTKFECNSDFFAPQFCELTLLPKMRQKSGAGEAAGEGVSGGRQEAGLPATRRELSQGP